MFNAAKPTPAAQFDVGDDCIVTFVEKSIPNNRFKGEVYSVVFGEKKFSVQMMKMNHRHDCDAWVFGYIADELTGKTIWTFPIDEWKIEHNFHGDVYTVSDEDGKTYVEYKEARTNKLCRRILFSELLGVSQPSVARRPTNLFTDQPVSNVVVLPAVPVWTMLTVKNKTSAEVSAKTVTSTPVSNQLQQLTNRSKEMRQFVEVLNRMSRAPEAMRARR